MLQQVCRLLVAQGAESESQIPPLQPYPRPSVLFEQLMIEEDEDGDG